MLVRIVHLSFRPDAVSAFEDLFERSAPHIRATEGCVHLELWQDADVPTRFTTYSLWTDASALDRYRASAFFVRTWAETKLLFASPPAAHSFTVRARH